MVASLLEPMTAILKTKEDEITAASSEQENAAKEKMAKVGQLLRDYLTCYDLEVLADALKLVSKLQMVICSFRK